MLLNAEHKTGSAIWTLQMFCKRHILERFLQVLIFFFLIIFSFLFFCSGEYSRQAFQFLDMVGLHPGIDPEALAACVERKVKKKLLALSCFTLYRFRACDRVTFLFILMIFFFFPLVIWVCVTFYWSLLVHVRFNFKYEGPLYKGGGGGICYGSACLF